jgi:hypothetical protein
MTVLNGKPVFGLPDRQFAGSAGHGRKDANSAGGDVKHHKDRRREIRREGTEDFLQRDGGSRGAANDDNVAVRQGLGLI